MTDISALLLLINRRKIHDQVKFPAEVGSAELQKFTAKVSSISQETSCCINEVTEYVLRIKDEIASLRVVLERFNVQLGEKIKDVFENGLTKGKIFYWNFMYFNCSCQIIVAMLYGRVHDISKFLSHLKTLPCFKASHSSKLRLLNCHILKFHCGK